MGWVSDRTVLAVDSVLKRLNFETDPIYSPRFRRFIKWFGYTAIPFVFSITSIMVMLYLFNIVYGKVGFERTIIIIAVLIWARIGK